MRIVKHFVNGFISFLLLILIMITMFITCNRFLISKKNISNFINEANVLNIDVNILFNQEESGITLKEKLISLALENNIPEEIIYDLIQTEEINEFLGDFFNQTIKYTINGGYKPQILDGTIEKMKIIANKSLNNHINVMLEDEQLDIYVEDYCNSIVNIIPNRNEMIGNIPIDILENILNFNVLYLCFIIILVLILISIINGSYYKFIKYLGIGMLISGLIFVLVGSLEYIISNIVLEQINTMKPFILSLITNLLTIWFKCGVLISFFSVVLLLVYSTINRISND